jgi:hypothetical protein
MAPLDNPSARGQRCADLGSLLTDDPIMDAKLLACVLLPERAYRRLRHASLLRRRLRSVTVISWNETATSPAVFRYPISIPRGPMT